MKIGDKVVPKDLDNLRKVRWRIFASWPNHAFQIKIFRLGKGITISRKEQSDNLSTPYRDELTSSESLR